MAGTKVSVDFAITGYNDITNRITEMGKKGNRATDSALWAAAEPIVDRMIDLAPERTGRGKSVIKIGKIRTLKGARYISIGIHGEDHNKGLHMYYQEFGTTRHKAQPFIRPGYEQQKMTAYEALKRTLKASLDLDDYHLQRTLLP